MKFQLPTLKYVEKMRWTSSPLQNTEKNNNNNNNNNKKPSKNNMSPTLRVRGHNKKPYKSNMSPKLFVWET